MKELQELRELGRWYARGDWKLFPWLFGRSHLHYLRDESVAVKMTLLRCPHRQEGFWQKRSGWRGVAL